MVYQSNIQDMCIYIYVLNIRSFLVFSDVLCGVFHPSPPPSLSLSLYIYIYIIFTVEESVEYAVSCPVNLTCDIPSYIKDTFLR